MAPDVHVHIRRCLPGDMARLSELARSTYRKQFAHLWTEAGFNTFLDQQFDAGRMAEDLSGDTVRFHFAEEAGSVVGYSKLVFDRRPPASELPPGVELEKIYFTPAAIGRGLGGQLIDHGIEQAANAGAPVVWLDVLKTNDRAQRAYMKRGFQIVGDIPFSTDTADIGFWVMARRLG